MASNRCVEIHSPLQYLREQNDKRSSKIGGRENLHDAAQAIKSTHHREDFFGHPCLFQSDGVPISQHRKDVCEAEGDICETKG